MKGANSWRRRGRVARERAKAQLRRDVLGLIARRTPALGDPLFVAVGNVGAVIQARLDEGWESELGVVWRSKRALPRRVAIKFAVFDDGEGGGRAARERTRVLRDLAGRLDAMPVEGEAPPICPYLALGLIEDEASGRTYVTEVMPFIEGRALHAVLRRGALDPAYALGQLAATLRTAALLEGLGYYTRNLDVKNVIVRPNGSWMRIDFDNARPERAFPARRMQRLARLTRQVLEALPGGGAERKAFLRRLSRLERLENGAGPMAGGDWDSPEALATAVDGLRRQEGASETAGTAWQTVEDGAGDATAAAE